MITFRKLLWNERERTFLLEKVTNHEVAISQNLAEMTMDRSVLFFQVMNLIARWLDPIHFCQQLLQDVANHPIDLSEGFQIVLSRLEADDEEKFFFPMMGRSACKGRASVGN